jgi:hypothetical protein
MLNNLKHDAALPTLLVSLAYIETDVPRMVLDFLEETV